MDVMTDIDKFYMDETPIGLPDFWPNNQNPPPTELEKTLTRFNAIKFWERESAKGKPEAETSPSVAPATETPKSKNDAPAPAAAADTDESALFGKD
jgi:hypothetical protein